MNFEEYMNPPVLDDIMEQIEDEVAKKKKYKDVIASYESDEQKLSIDTYWGKANFAVYSYDGSQFVVNKENSVEKHPQIEEFVDKEDQRIFKVLKSNHYWVEKHFQNIQ